jgi:pimeloyl-ACP methyl ester carboxylesterase
MNVFFISGLGADKTVFQFLDLSFCEPVFIEWGRPYKNETLEDYALRLKDLYIPDDAMIIGLSFGGMIATEIVKKYPGIKAVLISSSKTKYELPAYYRFAKFLPLYRLLSNTSVKWFMLHAKWLLGLSNKTQEKIYEDLIKRSDPFFNRWAINAIVTWKNTVIPDNLFHIHGTYDKVLPYKNVVCDYTIEKGEHLMVMQHADIISALLKDLVCSPSFKSSTLFSSANPPAPQNLK